MPLDISLPASTAISAVFHILAISSTSFRLYRRYKLRRLWWDDYWAGFTLLLEFVYFSSVWLRQEIGGGTQASPEERRRRVALFWISTTFGHLVVWSARISMCMSISRIDIRDVSIRIRKWVYALSAMCAMFACAIVAERIWLCAGRTDWHTNEYVHCYVGRTRGYISLVGDILLDTCLIIIPLHLLWRVRLHKRRRRLMLGLVTANLLSTVAGVLYAVTVLNSDKLEAARLILNLVSNVKATVTLMVCNLLVVATYTYSLFWKSANDSDSESTSDDEPGAPSDRVAPPFTNGGTQPNSVFAVTEFTEIITYSWQSSTRQSGGVTTSTSMTWPEGQSARVLATEDPRGSASSSGKMTKKSIAGS